MLPGSRFSMGYRSTTAAFKWIMLIAIVGTVVFLLVFRKVMNDTDEMYRQTDSQDSSGLGLITKESK